MAQPLLVDTLEDPFQPPGRSHHRHRADDLGVEDTESPVLQQRTKGWIWGVIWGLWGLFGVLEGYLGFGGIIWGFRGYLGF